GAARWPCSSHRGSAAGAISPGSRSAIDAGSPVDLGSSAPWNHRSRGTCRSYSLLRPCLTDAGLTRPRKMALPTDPVLTVFRGEAEVVTRVAGRLRAWEGHR